jgi:DNA invertase Pin-like site-specific DNA recombinase
LAARALDLCFGTTTPAGKFMRSIFASLAEYDRESILAKTKVGQQLAAAQGKPIGQSKGLDAENLGKGNKALDKPVHHRNRGATGSSLFSVKRYRQYIQASLSH